MSLTRSSGGPIPKPPPRRKWKRRALGPGQGAADWETFKQSVFFPSQFFGGDTRMDADHSMPLVVECSVTGCGVTGMLTLMDKPDQYGRFWHVEGMEVDHWEPRSHEPGMRFKLGNCQWMCHGHNTEKGGKHE